MAWPKRKVKAQSKITLKLDNSLKGLTEICKATILTGTVYYNENILIQISPGKRHIGQSPEEFYVHSLQVCSPSGTVQRVLISRKDA